MIDYSYIKEIFEYKGMPPVVHCITNYVTSGDVANIILAVGGSPVMAEDINEAEDIVKSASSLVINIGTLSERKTEAMILAGKAANKNGIPIVFDPVGAGASEFRGRSAMKILREVHPDIIRGNLSEMSWLCGKSKGTRGVDTSPEDEKNSRFEIAGIAALKFDCIAAVAGVEDAVSDGYRGYMIKNGTIHMSKVTGTGCMSSGLMGYFAALSKREKLLDYTAAAAALMGIAGECSAAEYIGRGLGSFRIGIIDYISKISFGEFMKMQKIEECVL